MRLNHRHGEAGLAEKCRRDGIQLLQLAPERVHYSCFSQACFDQVTDMPASSEFLISRHEELALHQRLVDGDLTASSEIASVFFEGLVNWLVSKNCSSVSEDFCVEAAEEAWLALVKNPASFNRDLGKRLGDYLRMSAQGDLRNLMNKEERRREKILESVQLSVRDGKYLETAHDPSLPLLLREEVEEAEHKILRIVRDGLSEGEVHVLDLITRGESKTAIFAKALGIDHLPKKEQAAEVNRVKNKIKKRLKRGASEEGGIDDGQKP